MLNPIVLEISEEEKSVLLSSLSQSKNYFTFALKFLSPTKEIKKCTINHLADIAALEYKISEAVAVVGQAHEGG